MGLFKPDAIKEVIAEREFSLVSPTGDDRTVTVLLGKPEKLPDADDYFCAFQIIGIDADTIRCTYGIDAFQALQLSMTAIGACLSSLSANGELLRWVGDEDGGFGFPMPE